LITLAKKDPQLDLHLVDAQVEHCKITNLHKTFARPVSDFKVPYTQLADRFNFTFHRQRIDFSLDDLVRWQQEKTISLLDQELSFDWLVICTGATPDLLPEWQDGVTQETLLLGQGSRLLEEYSDRLTEEPVNISLVGAGATGVQMLFELHDQLRKQWVTHQLRLIDLSPTTVPTLPQGAHKYIVRKMDRAGIEYLPETRFLGQQEGEISLEERESGRKYRLPSDLTLVFPGVRRSPFQLETNAYGQVLAAEQVLTDVFSAGDCSCFDSSGLNLLTGQAAVRKGKLVAHNVFSRSKDRPLRSYLYQEKGYLLSLGRVDAVGWVGLRSNLVKGFPALVLKEAMEGQYDLFLDGVDTYVGFP